MREDWTDSRLDDLNERVADMGRRMDEGFNRVHKDMRALRSETNGAIGSLREELRTDIRSLRHGLQGETGSLREELHTDIGALRDGLQGEAGSLREELHTDIASLRTDTGAKLDSLHRLVLQVAGGMFATFAIGFAGIIATQL